MEALWTMRQHSLMRTRSNVYTPVSVYTVGVGNKVDFKTTNMEDELQFSPKKCLHCVATVTKQFCRFHLHLSSLPPACPTRNATLPLWRQFHSLLSVIKNVITAATWRQSEVLADEPAQSFKFVQVVDSWDSRHSACPGSVTKRISQQNDLWHGDSCHAANQSLHPLNNYLPVLYEEG